NLTPPFDEIPVPTAPTLTARGGVVTSTGSIGLREDWAAPVASSAGLSPIPVRVAIGPLPSRSAAPLGGVLGAPDDPTPAVSPNDTLVVDLALQDLPRAEAAGPAVAADWPAVGADAVDQLAAFRGPG